MGDPPKRLGSADDGRPPLPRRPGQEPGKLVLKRRSQAGVRRDEQVGGFATKADTQRASTKPLMPTSLEAAVAAATTFAVVDSSFQAYG
jgi:hypothetical protein